MIVIQLLIKRDDMEGNFSAILKMIDEFGSCIFLHLICIKIHNGVCRHFDTYNKNYNSSYSHFIYTLMSLKNTEPVNPCQHLSLSLKSLQMHYHLGSFRIFKLLCGLKIQGGASSSAVECKILSSLAFESKIA